MLKLSSDGFQSLQIPMSTTGRDKISFECARTAKRNEKEAKYSFD